MENQQKESLIVLGTTNLRRLVCFLVCCVAIMAGPAASQEEESTSSLGKIRDGAVDVGFHASLVSLEEEMNSSIALRGEYLKVWGRFALGLGANSAYGHISSLDLVDFQGTVAGYLHIEDSSLYPFVGLSAGFRQEWLGSFNQLRYPVGIDVGIKALAGNRAGVTASYMYRRIVDDPIADFNEHRVVFGLSLLFRNQP